MRILTKEECDIENGFLSEKILRGAVFIYPTDTIYGIGCNALRHDSVQKIREIKERFENPFSVIAPSKEWIIQNCEADDNSKKEIEKLPGAVTLIMKLKNKDAVVREVNNGLDTLGIRIPDHWFTKFLSSLNIPIVTTSVNKTGEDFMTSLEDLDSGIKGSVNFMIYEGEKRGKPSRIVNLSQGNIIER